MPNSRARKIVVGAYSTRVGRPSLSTRVVLSLKSSREKSAFVRAKDGILKTNPAPPANQVEADTRDWEVVTRRSGEPPGVFGDKAAVPSA